MIRGIVSEDREALVDVELENSAGAVSAITAIVDTGFNGYLTLPYEVLNALGSRSLGRMTVTLADGSETEFDLHEIRVRWDGQPRLIDVDAAESIPLIGMSMLDGFVLRVDAVIGGEVTIERRPAQS